MLDKNVLQPNVPLFNRVNYFGNDVSSIYDDDLNLNFMLLNIR